MVYLSFSAIIERMRNLITALTKRVLFVAPVVWAVVTLVFLLIHIVPGDPVRNALGDNATEQQVNELKQKLGLDQPLLNQYVNYWRGVLKGDLGVSLINPSDHVLEKILKRYPATIELALAGLAFAIMVAIPLGVTAGRNQGKARDNIASVVALLGISTPGFVLGPLMIYLFAIKLNLLPVSGNYGPEYLILPAVTMGAPLADFLTR